ncbi:extracellular matrix protein A-like [Acipenser ruthenus]|uniref:extracellular matrix protein A-like n=1 Tax=Acipenser ruthenus TaxID=7906 RepID=UPI0027421B1F|nr:extracellular matrix protein A-like [Acipenser ruthenus]
MFLKPFWGNALSCNTCTNEADETKCAATACAAADTRCQSSYTLTAPDVPVSKACAQDCTPSATVKCCGTSQCNVDLLKCYTCTDLTDETKCKDITVCGFGDKFCKTTYKLTGTGVTVSKGCASTCTVTTAFPRDECCQGELCNDKFTCFQCAETADESSCTSSPCAAGTFCQSDYKLNGAGVPVVTKTCAADCKAVDNTADKNVRTTCCNTGYCNGNALSCNTCTNEADETKCAATACAATDKLCQSSYTLTAPDFPVSKACAEACTPSATVKCCGTSQCNVDLLKCYTCTDLTDETKCKDITVCGFGDKFCKTTYKLTGTGVTVSKGCASTCTVTTAFPRDECCQGELCNVNTLSCLQCDAQTDETQCKAGVCTVGTFCQNSYTFTNLASIKVTKTCESACTATNTVNCCQTSNCNVKALFCYTCDKQSDETLCTTVKACGSASGKCSSVYETGVDGKLTVTKGCEASRGACVPGRVGNKQTTCCDTDLCNVPVLKCYTCNKIKSETDCTTLTACDFSVGFCFAYYDTNPTGTTVRKGCDRTCASLDDLSRRRTCCTTDLCNEPKLSCYTCNGLADEKQCTTVTACSAENKFCKTVRNTIAGKKTAVTKTCEATCTASSTAFQSIECCQASQCNEYQERGTGASPSTQASSLLLAVSISLLTMLLKSA